MTIITNSHGNENSSYDDKHWYFKFMTGFESTTKHHSKYTGYIPALSFKKNISKEMEVFTLGIRYFFSSNQLSRLALATGLEDFDTNKTNLYCPFFASLEYSWKKNNYFGKSLLLRRYFPYFYNPTSVHMLVLQSNIGYLFNSRRAISSGIEIARQVNSNHIQTGYVWGTLASDISNDLSSELTVVHHWNTKDISHMDVYNILVAALILKY